MLLRAYTYMREAYTFHNSYLLHRRGISGASADDLYSFPQKLEAKKTCVRIQSAIAYNSNFVSQLTHSHPIILHTKER